jgi:ArsR family transcriptional regulator, lead/cadmium/zinc/bismuth-responsive transcriptional repressor
VLEAENTKLANRATCDETGTNPELVREARAAMPRSEEIGGATELLKAVGDPTRMRILAALSAAELCVCDLQATLSMSQSAVSHQLRVLRKARLVKYRRHGKMAYYSLDDDHVGDILRVSLEHVRHG